MSTKKVRDELFSQTLTQLRKTAKKEGLTKYSRMDKTAIVEAIIGNRQHNRVIALYQEDMPGFLRVRTPELTGTDADQVRVLLGRVFNNNPAWGPTTPGVELAGSRT